MLKSGDVSIGTPAHVKVYLFNLKRRPKNLSSVFLSLLIL